MVCSNCGSEIEQGVACLKCGAEGTVLETQKAFQAAAGAGGSGSAVSTSTVEIPKTVFCTNCGATVVQGQPCLACAARPTASAAIPVSISAAGNEVGLRALGYIIDVIPMIVVGVVLGWIPIIGAMIAGLIMLVTGCCAISPARVWAR